MTTPAIDVCDLSFAYDGQAEALAKVTLRVEPGEVLGLIGPNGAGKSTLFLCMVGVLGGYRGTIQVAGEAPNSSSQLAALRRKVGLVFQGCDDQLFNATVLEDVAFGPRNLGLSRDEAESRSREALQRVRVPESLHDRSPHALSNGQKRRVALAGILAMDPEVLLLDEPASDLDPRGRSELMQLLQEIGRTQIIAGHDLELIHSMCERVIVLDAGRIVADGPVEQIMRDADLMQAHGLAVPHSLQCCHEHGDVAHAHHTADHMTDGYE